MRKVLFQICVVYFVFLTLTSVFLFTYFETQFPCFLYLFQ